MKKIAVLAIRVYQVLHHAFLPILVAVFGFVSECPQKPSCSEYTILQIQKHGTITGLKRGLNRVLHCYRNANTY